MTAPVPVSEQIIIRPMSEADLPYFNATNEPFTIFGQLVPRIRTDDGHTARSCMPKPRILASPTTGWTGTNTPPTRKK